MPAPPRPTTEPPARHPWAKGVPWAIALASLALVVVLAEQKRALVDEVSALRQRRQSLQVGGYVPTVTVQTLDGTPVRLGETEGRPQVLIVFTTTCAFCRASLPAWKELARSVESAGGEFYAISLDSADVTREYRTAHDLPFPIIVLAQPKLRALYRAWVVPQTYVLVSRS